MRSARLRPVRAVYATVLGVVLVTAACSLGGARQAPNPSPSVVPQVSVGAGAPVTLVTIRRWNPKLVDSGYALEGTIPGPTPGTTPAAGTAGSTGTASKGASGTAGTPPGTTGTPSTAGGAAGTGTTGTSGSGLQTAPGSRGTTGASGTTSGVGGSVGTPGSGTTGAATRAGSGTVQVWGRGDAPSVQLLVSGGRVVGVRGLFAAADGPEPWFDSQTPTPTPSGTTTGTSGTTGAGGTGGTTGTTGAGTGTAAPQTGTAAGTTGTAAGTTGTTGTTGTGAATPSATGATAGGAAGTSAPKAGTGVPPGVRRGPTQAGKHGATSGVKGSGSPAAGSGGPWFTQTVWFERPGDSGAYGLSSWHRLVQLNPSLATSTQLTPFVPTMGFHWGHVGPGLDFLVDHNNRVTGVQGSFSAYTGWQPYYDQLPGHEDYVTATKRKMYTEHVWFVDPTTIR